MHALIMAGGEGSRLNFGEKPLVPVCGQPMIAYVIHAFRQAGCEPVIAVSPRTPMTQNWCRANGIALCPSEGRGFVEDMIDAVRFLEEEGPLFISVSDIPCITADIVSSIRTAYDACGKNALSTWVPAGMVKSCRGGMPYREEIDGVEACPAGINILRGDRIGEVQDEHALLLRNPCLALNVNTRADLAEAEAFMKQRTDE
jgi:adenosylcobinamide-phosphate guanylyltransferase